jgi:hypothetical protein
VLARHPPLQDDINAKVFEHGTVLDERAWQADIGAVVELLDAGADLTVGHLATACAFSERWTIGPGMWKKTTTIRMHTFY